MKTITLCDPDENPLVSILPGHHDAVTFNRAHAAEGWQCDAIDEDSLSHEYWCFDDDEDIWYCSNKNDLKAQPVTVLGW